MLEKYGIKKEDIHGVIMKIGLCLDDFDAWVGLSKKAKALMESGVINLDIIKEGTLIRVIIMENMTAEELSNIWTPNTQENEVEKRATSSET